MHDHLPLVCFIVCDSGPTEHFAEFVKNLLLEGKLRIDVYTSESTQTKFQDLHLFDGLRLFHFALDELNSDEEQKLAIELLDNCVMNGAQTIITDIANKFDVKLQEAFNKQDLSAQNIRLWCYYDNSEEYVPGGYSIRSGGMMKLSQNILFANVNLIKQNSKIFSFNNKNIQGIGYYPVKAAEKLQKRRESEREVLRTKYGCWTDMKYIFVYFGGNNKAYYEQAFPAFLSSLSHVDRKLLENILFLIHQHPVAKKLNQDGLLFKQWSLENDHIHATLSQLTSDEAQIIADGVLYYQTSMAPQFSLIGLPILQVGHEVYEDILVKHNLCQTATNATELMNGLKVLKKASYSSNQIQHKQLIYDALGYTSDWSRNLQNIIFDLE